MLDLAVMHAASFLGKFLAHVISAFDDVIAQLLELLAQLDLFLGNNGNRRFLRFRRRRRRFSATAQGRRHDGFFHLGRAAHGTCHKAARGLAVERGRIVEPAFEGVAGFATQPVTTHAGPPTTWRCVGSAMGSRISNRRPCWSEGMRARAAAPSAGSMSAKMTPGSVPPSARMRPQGSITSEWPKVSRPFSCLPPWAAANTKQPFSIARERISTCQ